MFRVGVFDSGIGGLTVLKECVRLAPDCAYYYLGDNFRAPYGSRPPEELLGFVREALLAFSEIGVDAAVLACNTATAVCADVLRREFPFPVIGTEPAVRPAARVCKRALVLATPATCASGRLHALTAQCPSCDFTLFPAEGLAAAIEKKLTKGEELSLDDHLPRGDFDGVVLGCTHYVFLRRQIADFYRLPTFDGNSGVARRLRSVLWDTVGTDRDETGEKLGFLTTNKRLQKMQKNLPKKGVFFIGNAKKCNKTVFKQMFATDF